ncbi:MAG: DUF2007 domain-containing protein [Planctomycetaceae bacterium]|nr:DUF2007 domain-containing protein [Planctomycetaceae bacterium]
MSMGSGTMAVRIATFASTVTAHTVAAHLEQHGIPARVIGDTLTDTLNHIGAVAQVDVVISAEQAPQALELINDLLTQQKSRPNSPWEATTQWRCAGCSELNEWSFDECWSCQTVRPETPEIVEVIPETVDLPSEFVSSATTEDSPYRPPEWRDQQPRRTTRREELRRRAMRGFILSPLFWPLFPVALVLFIRSLAAEEEPTSDN